MHPVHVELADEFTDRLAPATGAGDEQHIPGGIGLGDRTFRNQGIEKLLEVNRINIAKWNSLVAVSGRTSREELRLSLGLVERDDCVHVTLADERKFCGAQRFFENRENVALRDGLRSLNGYGGLNQWIDGIVQAE